MGFWDWLTGKKDDPEANADWKVYYEDMANGMTYGDRQKKLKSGGYAKGRAKPSENHGRIDDVELYKRYVKTSGKINAEIARRQGYFMK